ncbi:hypothetical protein [Streptomyces sp. NPDC097619]|uniref:hypothetical protein n=1 Tax=Streptomyces sp. NPDC097619 TaxID=3157228 RepID=UPI003318306E
MSFADPSVHPCAPSDAQFPAYVLTTVPASDVMHGRPNPHPVSRALLRALLINAAECGGAMAQDGLTGEISFTVSAGRPMGSARIALPMTNPHERCGTCGQWESEHGNPNPTACDDYSRYPRPGSLDNPLCMTPGCGMPLTHHGRPYAVSCNDFTPHPAGCECRWCLCDCHTVLEAPGERCHPDCSYENVGRLSDHCRDPHG